ncbi:hypothetical protein OG923_32600 [Streptomyces halstedii]|uniref:hypothetical protein n=1 Tax=Streptomyces halstedii TaxID=1944 RepID=UPI00324DA2BE
MLRPDAPVAADIPVLSGADLSAPAKDLVGLLRSDGLAAPDAAQVAAFEGSGKTALAVRLLGRLMRDHPATRPRFVTPSGTLRAHLLDAVRGHSAARELFPGIGSLRSRAARSSSTRGSA